MEFRDYDGHGSESELFAYISVDENGKSGICSCTTRLGITPMIGMTLKNMDRYNRIVEEIKKETDKEIKLVRYVQAEIIR